MKTVYITFRKIDHGDGVDIIGVYDNLEHAQFVANMAMDWRHTTDVCVRQASYLEDHAPEGFDARAASPRQGQE